MIFVFRAFGFGLWIAAASVAALLVLPFSPVRGVYRIAQIWARGALWIGGIEVTLEGEPPPAAAYLVIANHTSHFDVIALCATLPMPVRFVAKRELVAIPLFGWALALGGAIVIDRDNRKRAVGAIEQAKRAIAEGASVLMFPEGTRTPVGELGAFKKGPFYLATGACADVLPIGIEGTGTVLARGDWRIRSGRVYVRLGTPIAVAGYSDDKEGRKALALSARDAVFGLMQPGQPRGERESQTDRSSTFEA